jgi:hypothetical protein
MAERLSLTALLHSDVAWLTLFAFALAVLLLQFRQQERSVYLNTLWLFLIGVFGQAAALGLDAIAPGIANVVHAVSRIVAAIAFIRLTGFALFRLLLPIAGREWPRIVEDVVILVLYVIYGFVQLRGAGVVL